MTTAFECTKKWRAINMVTSRVSESYIFDVSKAVIGKSTLDADKVIANNVVRCNEIVIGSTYTIFEQGNCNWVDLGAANVNIGTMFTSTGNGTDTQTGSARLAGILDQVCFYHWGVALIRACIWIF